MKILSNFLKADKSAGPSVLKEYADVLTYPLHI